MMNMIFRILQNADDADFADLSGFYRTLIFYDDYDLLGFFRTRITLILRI